MTDENRTPSASRPAPRDAVGPAAAWLVVLALCAALCVGLDVPRHVPGWLADVAGLAWFGWIAGGALSLARRAGWAVRVACFVVLGAVALVLGPRSDGVPSGWWAAGGELALVAGATAAAMVLVPPMLAGKRAWDRRHPAPTAAQRLGLSGEAAADGRLPLRWSTGSRTVVLDDVGERWIEVVKVLRDLGSDLELLATASAVGRPEQGPAVPVVVATGLSDDDASVLVTALERCRATARVV
ncbi:hypothetical protein ACFT5B_18625 [Luteimicrobium sp. NPDC057192]|uniref:hypothetical protein n=1 Tax=Luteimicrobium sp. NPDC057192 TaxID=3346042 RepID=UPI003643E40B